MTKILSSIMAFILLLLALLGIRTTTDTGSFNNKDWMKNISDDKYISEITIPGTHDSCANYEPIKDAIKCQEYTLKDQLDMGVRFLDIRGMLVLNKMFMVHSIVPQGMTFDEVLDICYTFLEENPSETIIMSLKKDFLDNDAEFIEYSEKVITADSDKWFTENRIPQLSEVRGKIVLVSRFESSDSQFGIVPNPWSDDCSFITVKDNYTLHVQDDYEVSSNESKWALAEEFYSDCYKNADDKNLYINFISGNSGETIPDLMVVCDYMNPKFTEYMTTAPNGCYGITVMDFATEEMCELLINKNF